MSYLRPLNLQPGSLKQAALDTWLRHLLTLISDSQIISRGKPVLSPSIQSLEDCLKVLVSYQRGEEGSSRGCNGGEVYRCQGKPIRLNGALLSSYLDGLLPLGVQEEAFHR